MDAHPSTIRRVLLLLAASALLLVLLPAIFDGESLRAPLRNLFSPVCHQRAHRSFELNGAPLPICARCLGVYFGVFLLALLFELAKMRGIDASRHETTAARWVMVSLPLMALDVTGQSLAFWTRLPLSCFTGILAGGSIMAWICARSEALHHRQLPARFERNDRQWTT